MIWAIMEYFVIYVNVIKDVRRKRELIRMKLKKRIKEIIEKIKEIIAFLIVVRTRK